MNPEDLCPECMSVLQGTGCDQCGWREDAAGGSILFLPPRTILAGRYVIGNALGQGGFGITYLAWDLDLNCKLAVKEFFPMANATRSGDHKTVVAATAKRQELFRYGLKRFVAEGRALAKFRNHPNVVSVVNFLKENGTAYIVMHYVEGITLKDYMDTHGGRLPFQVAVNILLPVMDALRAVHAEGMLHRDISPDNIYINDSSQVQLLDFGATRHQLGEHSETLQSILKPGYAPEEQYRSGGAQGPWTDVYAVGATLYQTLTGQLPPEALDRMAEDKLKPPGELGVEMPHAAEEALLKALAVRHKDRFQDIAAFQEALLRDGACSDPRPLTRLRAVSPAAWRKYGLIAAGMVCVLVLSGVALVIGSRRASTMPTLPVIGEIKGTAEPAPPPVVGMTPLVPVPNPRIPVPDTAAPKVPANPKTVAAPIAILSFAPDRSSVNPGQRVLLQWSVTGVVDSISLNPGASLPASATNASVVPAGTTEYTLTARNAKTAIEARCRVEVVPYSPPAIAHLRAEPESIAPGQSARLSWEATGQIDSIELVPHVAVAQGSSNVDVSPITTTHYKLEVSGPGGKASESVTVEVAGRVEPPPPVTPAPVTVTAPNTEAEAQRAFREAQKQLDAKNYQDAAVLFGRAAGFNRQWKDPLIQRAMVESKLGLFKAVIEDSDEALHIDPNDAEAHNYKGFALYNLNRHREAVSEFDVAIRLNPDYADAYTNRGNAKVQLHDGAGANADFATGKSLKQISKKR